jgi:hypothetical protein
MWKLGPTAASSLGRRAEIHATRKSPYLVISCVDLLISCVGDTMLNALDQF